MREGVIVGLMAGGLALVILAAAMMVSGVSVFGPRKGPRRVVDRGVTLPPRDGKVPMPRGGGAGLDGARIPKDVAEDVDLFVALNGLEAQGQAAEPGRVGTERQRVEVTRRLATGGPVIVQAVVAQWASADREGRMALARLLAQQQDPVDPTVLVDLYVGEQDSVVRRLLVQALGRLNPPEPMVLNLLGYEADPRVRSDLLAALGDLEEKPTIAAVMTIASAASEDLNVRARAISALSRTSEDSTRRVLEDLGRGDPDWRVREKCVQAVAQGWPLGCMAYLERAWFAEQDPRVRIGLLYAAARVNTPQAEEFIRKAAEADADPQVRERALAILKDLAQQPGKGLMQR